MSGLLTYRKFKFIKCNKKISKHSDLKIKDHGFVWNGQMFVASKIALLKALYYLHFVLLFWNQVLTWASVIFKFLAICARSVLARYF